MVLFFLGQSLYIGTQSGDILHYFRAGDDINSPYIFASRQRTYTRKARAVSKIMLFPSVSIALVLGNNLSTSVFSLPEFAPCTGMGSLREVNDFSYDVDDKSVANDKSKGGPDQVNVTVFAKSVIRVVQVKSDSLKLVKNIEYPGVIVGVRRSSYALVANAESYDLVDLQNVRKIPLFPISQGGNEPEPETEATSESKDEYKKEPESCSWSVTEEGKDQRIEPIIVPVASNEFLVTSGTTITEPSMGLVINVDGDITRGTIAWPQYPTSVAVDYPYVAAVVGNAVQFNTLHDQSLIQTIQFESLPLLFTVLTPYTVSYQQLADKIRLVPLREEQKHDAERISKQKEIASKLSNISSSLQIYSEKAGVECLLSSPRLLYLEKMVKDNKIDEVNVEMEGLEITTEQAVVALEYLKLLIGLNYLEKKDFHNSKVMWLEGSLDPRILIYIFSDKADVIGDVWLFNGVKGTVEQISASLTQDTSEWRIFKNKPDDELKNFYKSFLLAWLKKRDLESVVDKAHILISIELAYLRYLLTNECANEEIREFIDNELIETRDNTIVEELLLARTKFTLLLRLYQKQGRIKDVLEGWKKLLSGEWVDDNLEKGEEEKMCRYLMTECKDEELIWEYGMWLVEKYPKTGIKVFTNATVQYDDHNVIERFKKFEDDFAWRQYLKYLVYDKQSALFTSDLVTFLVNDLLEKMSTPDLRNHVQETNTLYGSSGLPKQSYLNYLKRLHNQRQLGENVNAVDKLRLELVELLRSSNDYDIEWVKARLEERCSDLLLLELCVMYSRLGLHDNCLIILCHKLGDYNTAIEYCERGGFGETKAEVAIQRDLFGALFIEYLKIRIESVRIYCVRRLVEEHSAKLDVMLVLNRTPASWPLETFSVYLSHIFRNIISQKNQSNLNKSVSRADNVFVSDQLLEIQQKERMINSNK